MEIWLDAARAVPAICWVLPAACTLYFVANMAAVMRWITPDTWVTMLIVVAVAMFFFAKLPPETLPIPSRMLVLMPVAALSIVGVTLHVAVWLGDFRHEW